MYWLTKITKHKVLLGILASIVLGMVLLPAAPALTACVNDSDCAAGEVCTAGSCVASDDAEINFGLVYGEDTGLGSQDVRQTISKIINVALGLLGIVAVVIMLIGGFEWMTAGGNEEKVTSAKQRIFMGILGLAIILSAYAIARFVLEQLYIATTGESSYGVEDLGE